MNSLISRKFLIPTVVLAVLYLVITILLMNHTLVFQTLTGAFSVNYKVTLLTALMGGMWTAMSHQALFLLVIVAILTGFNLTLLIQRITLLRHAKGLHFIAGGGTLLGIVGAGCASCGLPILSLLGIGGSLLPFGGEGLLIVALILLSVSVYLLVKSNTQLCEIKLPTKRNEKNFAFTK